MKLAITLFRAKIKRFLCRSACECVKLNNSDSNSVFTTFSEILNTMVCYCLDLRCDSKLAKFLSNKFISVFVGLIQLVLWSSALLAFMVQPGPLKEQIQTSETGAIAFAVILVLACIAFSILLLIGLFKNNRSYIKTYVIFIIVLTVLIVVSMIVNIFTQPKKFGLSGFLSSIFMTFLNLLTYFVVRNYYLAFISKDQNQLNQNRV